MYENGISPQVRRFLAPLEDALRNSTAWGALARLVTVATILQAYEDWARTLRANAGQTQLDLFEAKSRATRGQSKT